MEDQPQIVSTNNKSERIAQREERVRSRLNESTNEVTSKKPRDRTEQEEDTKTSHSSSIGQQQISDSLAMIERLKHSSTDEVTRVRAEMDQRESRRRIEEENRRNASS